MSKVLTAVLEIGAAVAVLAIPGVGEIAEVGLVSLGVSGAAAATIVTGVALSVGLSAAESVFTKTPSLSNSLASRLGLDVDSVATRKIVFGNTAAACDLRFKEIYGKDSDRIALAIGLASHQLHSIQSLTLGYALIKFWRSGRVDDSSSWKGAMDEPASVRVVGL